MLKKIIFILLVILLIWQSTRILTAENKSSLEKVKKYRIYYRGIDDEIITDMEKYDLLIVEALNFEKEDVRNIKKKKNTILIGYLSTIEIGHWDEEILEKMNEEDYMTFEGKTLYNKSFKNPLADISQEHYQEILLNTLEERILSKGMDGVFLDTVDWIDYYSTNEEIYKKLNKGYEEVLKKIRKKYPDIYIIQNRGFKSVIDFSSDYIDGLLWENLNVNEFDEDYQETFKKLQEINSKNKFVIFSLSFEDERENSIFTKKLNWKHMYLEKDGRYTKW
ncbi:hypothetical protein Curi_c25150 [Gottschalkia acidurici 9a]|uniref:Glycoside-hydrolase family GH114 TIM-barrel domain-containing protein n=1 Tax=Gottschalkia acidurici (strain ATCC 7906 / DSM 604 / BCRC 14475 / CIP 104303 / KCTC 5404 / NCIMB 10678 / 9a) TaxID=1128398 RepID=K0B3Q6_GOTA9|nr:endo alpha-1,4 polygalactosaminidase [Gottschalkia acidurici]AFS79510.1 hypothetical protein Curi_c25150 [Gottschalkia acidurici 9a]